MGTAAGIITIIVYFVINLIIANMMKQAAYAKGYDDNAHAWAMTFWFGIIGCIYVAALPDLIARQNQEQIIEKLSGKATPAPGDNTGNEGWDDSLPKI